MSKEELIQELEGCHQEIAVLQKASEQKRLTDALQQTVEALNSTLELDKVLDLILEHVTQVVEHNTANIMLIENGIARVVRTRGYIERGFDPEEFKKAVNFPVRETSNLQHIVETGEAYVIPDVSRYSAWVNTIYSDWIRSHIAIPIRLKDEIIGFLNLDSETPNFFNGSYNNALQRFADQVAIAVHNAQLFEEVQSRNKALMTLHRATTSLASNLDLELTLNAIAQELAQLLEVECCAVSKWDRENNTIPVLYQYDPNGIFKSLDPEIESDYPLDEYLISKQILEEQIPIQYTHTDNIVFSEKRYMERFGIKTVLKIPMLVGNMVIGLADLEDSREERSFTQDEIAIAQLFLNHAAYAIENARLFQQVEKIATELAQSNQDLANEIEERKQIESELRESEQRFRTLIDMAPIAIFSKDVEGRYTNVNTETLRYWEKSPIGHRDDELLPAWIAYSLRTADLQVMETGESLMAEELFESAAIGRRTLLTKKVPLFGADGQVNGVLGTSVDITERKKAEAALRESEEKYRAILDNIQEGYYETNMSGEFTFCNRALTTILGYSQEDLIGKNYRDLYRDEMALNAVMPLFRTVMRTGIAVRSFEAEIIHKNGQVRLIESSVALIHNNLGEAIGFRGVSRDATERKEIEETLQAALSKEKELNAMKDSFMSMASHEFRTPISVISTSNQILRRYYDNLLPEQREKHLGRISEQVKHLSNMIENIMMVLQTSTDPLSFRPVQVNLTQLCTEIIESVRYSVGSEHIFAFQYQEDLDDIWADHRLLQIMISNLLSNAIKYSPIQSEILLEIKQEGHEQILSIVDHGIGISKEAQKHLFKAYYRGDYTGHVKGIGLGLKIVKDFVELHKGQISVESELNEGTSVRIRLPIKSHEEVS